MTNVFAAADEPTPLNFVWSEFVLVLIIFAILFYLVRKYVVPNFEKTFTARREAIEGGIERAEEAQNEAQRLLEQYREQLNEARIEAAQIRENARAEAQRTLEDLRAQAREESERIIARGEEQLAGQRSAVVRELRAEVGSLAIELAEKIVDQRLADEAQVSATVDAFLAGLEAQNDATSTGTAARGDNA